jgi:hypothetical protein
MSFETQETDETAHRDHAATEPPADADEHADSGESGGPYGNPDVDEESLRKHQEQSSDKD